MMIFSDFFDSSFPIHRFKWEASKQLIKNGHKCSFRRCKYSYGTLDSFHTKA